ncbi:MAG: hypothetical protein WAQ53_01175 [Thiofilum sp.]|uniref:hypothetical protein n=1 Tax=Thiofilum sp. TaxID=2212733 RepID=UPI0025EA340C|nr:hypothetical protein [Thiofilum sp.]MBK8455506.1 hypothetical protein [Thiofilum sp.]
MSVTSKGAVTSDIHRYGDFLHAIRKTFKTSSKEPLFITNTTDLWELFLNHLPAATRQEYTCSACRQFVQRFGNLVRIDEQGNTQSVLWNTKAVPAFFQPSVRAMQQAVEQARVMSVFVSSAPVYGQPQTAHWKHMAVTPEVVWSSRLLNSGQYQAKKLEEFNMLSRALETFAPTTADTAVKLLRFDKLYRSEKVLGVAEWFRAIQQRLNASPSPKQRHNQQWLAVATAPEGFCHVRSSMIGTLLEDIELGFEYEEIRRSFAAKMHPLQYQRPQTPPSAGNIKQAEKIMAELKAEQALERRFARLEELKLLWKPKASSSSTKAQVGNKVTGVGAFGHLLPKTQSRAVQAMKLPLQTMTWEKFERKVLPDAFKVEYLVPATPQNYIAITTAVNFNATPILQWDRVEQRNPFAVYVYHNGSKPLDWNLKQGYVEVTGICTNPPNWYKELSHQHKGAILVLKGAKDRHYLGAGAAIFPENLISEFHPIRKTIEAYSKTARLQGFEAASACGLFISSGGELNHRLRVTSELGVQEYCIDRWD